MEFFDLQPSFELYKRVDPTLDVRSFAERVKRELKSRHYEPMQEAHELLRFEKEHIWTDLTKPYFKIWPEVIPMLTDVSIDVPAKCLRLPYKVFLLRLPCVGSPLKIDDQFQIHSILVTEVGDSANRFVYLWTDIGEKESNGRPMLHWHRLRCNSDESIDAAFQGRQMPGLPGMGISNDLADKCLRLAVSICFLSTGMDRLIEPDILSKDLSTYLEAHRRRDESRMKSIRERALRRKGRGWIVGGPDRLRRVVAPPQHDDSKAGTGQPMTHQHQRRAHFRLLASGTVVFVRQATVRPDLPPDLSRSAYALK